MDENQIVEMLDQLAEFQAQADVLQMEKERLLQEAIPPEVKTRIAEINAEFGSSEDAVANNIGILQARIKEAVAAIGHSIKGTSFHAIYAKGRVTWDANRLDGLSVAFPQIKEARKEGEPTVSLRVSK